MSSNKLKILNNIINKYKSLPKQGTKEWLDIRKNCIGGSEISIITGNNPYKKINDLILSKIGLSKFNGNTATKWGKLFEIITTEYCKIILNISEIYETSSLPTINNNIRYSPDGLAIGNFNINNNKKEKIILFEFKSPLSSIPIGIVPDYYLPQVKLGMWAINEVDISLFVNNMYRKCSYENFNNNNKYDNIFHKSDIKKNIKVENPISMGMILFYQNKDQSEKFINNIECDINESFDDVIYNDINCVNRMPIKILYQNYYKKNKKTLLDIGKLKKNDFDIILNLFNNNDISILLSKPLIFEEINNLEIFKKNIFDKPTINKISVEKYKKKNLKKFKSIIKKNNSLGILCWKLFKSDIILIERDNEFIEKHINKVNGVINDVKTLKKKINNTQTPVEIYNEYIRQKKNKNNLDKKNKFNINKVKKLI